MYSRRDVIMAKEVSVSEVKKQVAAMVTTAFGLVAALFWNDAIKALITEYVGQGSAWPAMMLSAVIVTIIAVIAVFLISKYLGDKE